eukprot:IDg7518t1
MKNLIPVETTQIGKRSEKVSLKTLESTGFCPRRNFDKNPQIFEQSDSRFRTGYLWCACSPQRSVTPKERKTVSESLGRLAEMKKRSMAAGVRKSAVQGNESLCSWDSKTLRNIGPDYLGKPNAVVTLGKCRTSQLFEVFGSSSGSKGGLQVRAKGSANEGCVAAHHLTGYSLQHRENLMRPVLCAHGLCATPNHALLYRGVLTSMRHLCISQDWSCVYAVMPVNNLNVIKNRQVRFSKDIVITPYDIRFPRFATWVAQILENALEVSLITLQVFWVSSVIAFTFEKAANYFWDEKHQ